MTSTPKRADPLDFDLSGFKPKASSAPRPPIEEIRAVSEAQGFPSRAAPTKTEPTETVTTGQVRVTSVRPARRYRTGRTVQFNMKASPDVVARFSRLADENGWVLGETLEHAVEALERQLGRGEGS